MSWSVEVYWDDRFDFAHEVDTYTEALEVYGKEIARCANQRSEHHLRVDLNEVKRKCLESIDIPPQSKEEVDGG